MLKIRNKDWIEIVLHIAFWVGVFYTLLTFTQPEIKMRINNNGSITDEDIRYTLSPHIFLTLGFMVVLFYGNIFLVFKNALRYKNIVIRVALPVAWFAIIFMADNYADTLLPAPKKSDPMLFAPPPKPGMDTIVARLPGPADIMTHVRSDTAMREVARQESRNFIFATDGFSNTLLFIFIIVFGLSIAYFFLKEWSKVEKMRSELAAVQLDTEVKFLKSQVNPHFLFNTLNNLFSMAQKEGNDDLADGISKLSGMMRYMIYESNAETVPLSKEIEYLHNCIALNQLRYASDEARVNFEHPQNTGGVQIAPMLFIPFVENAFKYGVVVGQPSQIDIAVIVNGSAVEFTCRNRNYSYVKKMDDNNSGIGLENVKRRLELAYPGKYWLDIKNTADEYAVLLKIDTQ
ncbi:MAG TPA: histidine kinase [Mucilaginibacter sp.]|nr:histidine kinase [Mucilaginibacter sp.]